MNPNAPTTPNPAPLASSNPTPADGMWWKVGLVLLVGGAVLYYGSKKSARAYR